jgi:hypothetical protein
MCINLLSRLSLTLLVMFAISCSNKRTNGSTTTQESSVTEATELPASSGSKKYDLKSGIVSYTTEVMGMKNPMKIYFDDYGAKELTETVMEMEIMGTKSRTETYSLTMDGFKYDYTIETINNEDKSKKEIRKSKFSGSSSTDMNEMAKTMSDEMKKKYEYKDEGNETVAGVVGTKYSMKVGSTKYVGVTYKKVMMKTVSDMINITADKIEENVSIPAEKFGLPKDYTIIEAQ